MQVPRGLSAVQCDSLEASFICFRGITTFLESVESKLQPDERLTAENLRELAAMCERKLLEAFPDIIAWLADWERRGAGQ
jgi:hypothetical protein